MFFFTSSACVQGIRKKNIHREVTSLGAVLENLKFYGLYSFLVRGNYSNKSCNNFKMKILYNHSNMLYPTPFSASLNNMDPFKHIDKILQMTAFSWKEIIQINHAIISWKLKYFIIIRICFTLSLALPLSTIWIPLNI